MVTPVVRQAAKVRLVVDAVVTAGHNTVIVVVRAAMSEVCDGHCLQTRLCHEPQQRLRPEMRDDRHDAFRRHTTVLERGGLRGVTAGVLAGVLAGHDGEENG